MSGSKVFDKVAIIGTGLIGGSIGLAIKEKNLANKIIGVARRKETLEWAKRRHAIDIGSQDLNIIRDADCIILAAPVEAIISLSEKISRIIKTGCVVTDVGSTKKEIALKLSSIFPGYIGGHPLAGSEKTGILNASPGIFKNSLCILTPGERSKKEALEKVKKLWLKLGAKVVCMPADTHDKILSFTSHLPHALAFSLMGIVPKGYLKFSASGLRDTARIAGSDSQLWAQIFLSNRKNVARAIDVFQKRISELKSAIHKKDRKKLVQILNEANKKHSKLTTLSQS